jgi:hypothetical protein
MARVVSGMENVDPAGAFATIRTLAGAACGWALVDSEPVKAMPPRTSIATKTNLPHLLNRICITRLAYMEPRHEIKNSESYLRSSQCRQTPYAFLVAGLNAEYNLSRKVFVLRK